MSLSITADLRATHRVHLGVYVRIMLTSAITGAIVKLLLDRQSEVSRALCPLVVIVFPLLLYFAASILTDTSHGHSSSAYASTDASPSPDSTLLFSAL